MAPAEIWQGGRIVNKIVLPNTHEGKLGGETLVVRDSGLSCDLCLKEKRETRRLSTGDSITLDGGEIVKSVGR